MTLNGFYKVYKIESLKNLAIILERNTQTLPKLLSFITVLLIFKAMVKHKQFMNYRRFHRERGQRIG